MASSMSVVHIRSTRRCAYNANGSLDTSFGSGGMAWVNMHFSDLDSDYSSAEISQIIIQPDGKILAGGFDNVAANPYTGWMAARFNPNGSVDTTFGNAWFASGFADILPQNVDASSSPPTMALQPDGRILIGASTTVYDVEVHRLTPDGLPDSTFDVAQDYFPTNDPFPAKSAGLVLEPDNRIVVVGNPLDPNDDTKTEIGLIRLQNDLASTPPNMVANPPAEPADGDLDPSYGFAGCAFVDDPSQLWIDGPQLSVAASALQSDGKLVLVGGTDGGNGSMLIERLNADGTIDTTFGNDGQLVVSFPGISRRDQRRDSTRRQDSRWRDGSGRWPGLRIRDGPAEHERNARYNVWNRRQTRHRFYGKRTNRFDGALFKW